MNMRYCCLGLALLVSSLSAAAGAGHCDRGHGVMPCNPSASAELEEGCFAPSAPYTELPVKHYPKEGQSTVLLKPGETFRLTVDFPKRSIPTKKYVRVIGGVDMPAPFTARGEDLFREEEWLIEDNLDASVHCRDARTLYFKGEDDDFERYVYMRIPANRLGSAPLTFRLPLVRRRAFEVMPNGHFTARFEIYRKKVGRHSLDIYDSADSVIEYDLPSGTADLTEICKTVAFPEDTACVLLRIGGTHFRGECWVEAPDFLRDGKTVWHSPFVPEAERKDRENYWVGCNFSTRFWPKWRLECNGKQIFEGHVFDRASNMADFYLPLPSALSGPCELALTLLDESPRRSFAYGVHRVETLETSARGFETVAVPKYVRVGTSFGLLFETQRPGTTLTVTSPAFSPACQKVTFDRAGLNAVTLTAGMPGIRLPVTVSDGTRTQTVVVQQVLDLPYEAMYVSSGDEIYVDKEFMPYDLFFKWYFSQRIGNWYHFRPSYQWSGTRVTKPEVVRCYTDLLNLLRVPYTWQLDGRTTSVARLNLPYSDLASPMFRGFQTHENDGNYLYWNNHIPHKGLVSDILARTFPKGGIFSKHRPIYSEQGAFARFSPYAAESVPDGARQFVTNLADARGDYVRRHTGPSVQFRSLYRAGYDWLGTEQMYGLEDITMSALRGASKVYGRTHYGSVHPIQWGSRDFNSPQHARRHFLSLAVGYMHGSSHMHTEEALWLDEWVNDRYSEGGQAHIRAQHTMLDFAETHARRGNHHTPIAVLQGRCDPWHIFGHTPVWSQWGGKWAFNRACESFDLLKVFYPKSAVTTAGPDHWFTDTPFGVVDLLPIEATPARLAEYRMVAFLGWNTYSNDDFAHLLEYVRQGGTLLLTAAHVNAEEQPHLPPKFPAEDTAVRRLLGDGYRALKTPTVIPNGRGRVIYFPENRYPADPALREAYTEALMAEARRAVQPESNRGWVLPAPYIDFSVWDEGVRRTVYVLNTDWKTEVNAHPFTLVFGGASFELKQPRNQLGTIHCFPGFALVPDGNTTDVLSLTEKNGSAEVVIQTTGPDRVEILCAKTGQRSVRTLPAAGIHKIVLSSEK